MGRGWVPQPVERGGAPTIIVSQCVGVGYPNPSSNGSPYDNSVSIGRGWVRAGSPYDNSVSIGRGWVPQPVERGAAPTIILSQCVGVGYPNPSGEGSPYDNIVSMRRGWVPQPVASPYDNIVSMRRGWVPQPVERRQPIR